jgi:PAS domain S-box-containing protein
MNEESPNSAAPGEFARRDDASSLRGLARPGVAWVVLGLCLVVTFIAWRVSVLQLRHRDQERFRRHIDRVNQAIETRVQDCEQLLKGATGLFAASQSVGRGEWHNFITSLSLDGFPGIKAMGFIANVPAEERGSFTASNRLDGALQFTIHPNNANIPRSNYYVVKFVEPMADPAILGFDIASDSRLSEPAELARDTGNAVLTGRIELEGYRESPPAMMLLLPVYQFGVAKTNEFQRRMATEGWVCALVVPSELMKGLPEGHDPQIDFAVFDGSQAGRLNRLYDSADAFGGRESQPATIETNVPPLSLARRSWSLHFSTRQAFGAATDQTEPRLLLFGGICISFLLFGITRSLASTHQRALVLARRMTKQFRIQERAVISSNNGIFITDASEPDRPIIYANPAMERITGYSAEEMVGRNTSFLIGNDRAQPDWPRLERAFSAGEKCQVVLRCYRKDAALFWNELSVSPVRDEHGLVTHFVGITEDITERKRAEETLRANSAFQRAILDSAGYSVISTSPDGLILIFNATAERMTGYKAAEVVGKFSPLLIHDLAEVEKRARQLSAELGRPVPPGFDVFVAKARIGHPDEHEWTYVRKDGSRLPVLLSVTSVRDERGVILGFMSIASDITQRKRAESQLQQATLAAETASRAKGEFLANMSHEIRTPMNAVMGMTELALGTDLTREQRGYLMAVRNSATDLLTIIDDVLDFSKIEAGKLELHLEPFRLRDALGLGLKTFSLRAAEKGLELTLRVRPDVPDAVVGDVGRLRQILNNLVGNALKFTDRGEVAVEVSLADSDISRQNATIAPGGTPESGAQGCLLHVRVADSGIGIPLDKQQAIFEAFTQADASVTRKYGGTGLGLAIASRLCRLMGGEIWVESKPGHGSQFHFTARFELSPVSAPPAAVPELDGARVLVVDDNATNRQNLCEMLSNWRLTPTAAASAREALNTLRASAASGTPFRFALLDAMMADTDGFKLAQEFNGILPEAPSIIMMLSSTGRSDELKRCRECAIDTYLVKPVGQSELLDALLHRAGTIVKEAESVAEHARHAPTRTAPLRVLVAEDNSVNRELATTVLQKLGHSVVTASNGQETLSAWQRTRPDMILMDVQMPAMDGLEATAHIRRLEQGTGRHVPIIGLTAHAMKGDREDGLAAGMDDYLTKPLQLDDLRRAIEQWKPKIAADSQEPSNVPANESFECANLLKSLDGDTAALRRLVTLFLDTTPSLLADIRTAVRQRNASALEHAAHTLKGSLTHLEEAKSRGVAAELERLAHLGDLEHTMSLAAQLDQSLTPFQESLQRWLKSQT